MSQSELRVQPSQPTQKKNQAMDIQQLYNKLKQLSDFPSQFNHEDRIKTLIMPDKKQQIWQESTQKQNTNLSCWNAYLNHLALEAFKEIIFEGLDISSPSESLTIPKTEELAVFWDFVNGTPMGLNDSSILLVPQKTTELEYIEVPQEWIDISNLAADYYVIFQIEIEAEFSDNELEDNFDRASIELVGVTTHQTLKQKGYYDQSKRNYCLDVRHLFSLNVMWTSQQINLQVSTPIQDLPTLPKERKDYLFSELEKSLLSSPRLEIPFLQWSGIFGNRQYRQQLYQLRTESQDKSHKLSNI